MRIVLDHPLAVLVGLTAATWPVWRWYVLRLGDGSDEQWGVLALGAVIALTLGRRTTAPQSASLLPVLTGLLAVYVLFGIVAYRSLPVAELPNVDFPTIEDTARLAGANPETMGSAVAT